MRDNGIQIIGDPSAGVVGDLLIDVKTDNTGLITSGLTIGNTLEQNKALILIAEPGSFKQFPTLGVGINSALLSDDFLFLRHIIRREFQKDKLTITKLDLYPNQPILINAKY